MSSNTHGTALSAVPAYQNGQDHGDNEVWGVQCALPGLPAGLEAYYRVEQDLFMIRSPELQQFVFLNGGYTPLGFEAALFAIGCSPLPNLDTPPHE